jgi:hypothetical protein
LKGKGELAEVALRMARAFRKFEGFVYQRELDPPELIGRVVRESGIGLLVLNKLLDGRKGVYALIPNDKGCRTECTYGGPCDPSDKKCVEKCVEECRVKIVRRIVEALEKYAERVRRRGG